MKKYEFSNLEEQLGRLYRNLFRHEILHNLGGVHADEGALIDSPIVTVHQPQIRGSGPDLLSGKSFIKEQFLKGDNIAKIFERIGLPVRTVIAGEYNTMTGEIKKINTKDVWKN